MHPLHFALTPTSPVVTPLRGDTLLGHLCWMFAYQRGEEALLRLLANLTDDPPAISDLFPEGKLPRPQMPLPHSDGDAKEYRKEIKSIRFIGFDEWVRLRMELRGEEVLGLLVKAAKARRAKRLADMLTGSRQEKPSEDLSELHSTINRLTGTTGDAGGLYARVRTHYAPGVRLHAYLHPGIFGEEAFDLLEKVGGNGYGADASTGCGTFEIERIEDGDDLFDLPGADGWMSLSRHLPPAGVDLDRSCWRIETHYGRLGGSFASSGNPFKKPLLLIDCGSVWRQRPFPTAPPGAHLPNVGFRDELIRHLGYTIPMPFKWGNSQ